MNANETNIRLGVKGGEQVEAGFNKVSKSGTIAAQKIADSLKGANPALKVMDKTAVKAKGNFSALTGKLGGFGKIIDFVGPKTSVFLGILGSGAGIVSRLNSELDKSDAIEKFATRIGISTEALSQYKLVAEKANISQQSFQTALQRMERRVAEVALSGTGTAADTIKALNINIDEFVKLSPDKKFEQLAESLSKVDSQGEKLLHAFKFFDTEGVSILQAIGGGAAGILATRKEADALGLTLNELDAKKLAEIKDQMALVGGGISGLSRKLLIELEPTIHTVLEPMVDLLKEANTSFTLAEKIKSQEQVVKNNASFGLIDLLTYPGLFHDAEYELSKLETMQLEFARKGLLKKASIAQEERSRREGLELQTLEKLSQFQKDADKKNAELTETKIQRVSRETDEKIRELERFAKVLKDNEEGLLKVEQAKSQLFINENIKISKIREEQIKKLAEAAKKEEAIIERKRQATLREIESNDKLVSSMDRQLKQMSMTDLQKQIDINLSRLNANATDSQRKRIEDLTRAIQEKTEALKEDAKIQNAIKQEIISQPLQGIDPKSDKIFAEKVRSAQQLNEQFLNPSARFKRDTERLQKIRDAEGVGLNTEAFDGQMKRIAENYGRSIEDMEKKSDTGVDRILNSIDRLSSGVENNFTNTFSKILDREEDFFSGFTDIVKTARNEVIRQFLSKPLTDGLLGGIKNFAGDGGFGGFLDAFSIFHGGGVVGRTSAPSRMMPSALLHTMPRLHNGLRPDEVPAILQKGETVIPKNKSFGNNVTIHQTITFSNGNVSEQNNAPADLKRLGDQMSGVVRQVIHDEMRSGGLLEGAR